MAYNRKNFTNFLSIFFVVVYLGCVITKINKSQNISACYVRYVLFILEKTKQKGSIDPFGPSTQQTCKIGPMLAISWQGWQNVGKFANTLPMLPMFCQHLCKRRNYCRSKFPRIFSRLCNDSGPFSFTYSFPICQKYFFFITIQPTLVEYWLNIGCQHRHYRYAFQPIQGQRWMPAPGQHWWIKFFLTTDNFL